MAHKIILGTVQFGLDYGINNNYGKPDLNSINEILNKAYQAGIHTLDTAEAYGDAEAIIGSFHQNKSFRFDVNTKFRGGEELRTELIKAIEKLRIQRVHTFFYHSFNDYISYPGLPRKLKQLKSENLINQIGVSVYSNNELETACSDPAIDVIQLPFNLLDNISQRGALLRKARMNKKIIQVRSVFLQGLFFKDISTLPVFLLPLKPYLKKLQNICTETGLSTESICLQYANAQPDIDEIIIGVDNKEQLTNNMDSLHVELDQDIRKEIDAIHVTETELLYPFNWK